MKDETQKKTMKKTDERKYLPPNIRFDKLLNTITELELKGGTSEKKMKEMISTKSYKIIKDILDLKHGQKSFVGKGLPHDIAKYAQD